MSGRGTANLLTRTTAVLGATVLHPLPGTLALLNRGTSRRRPLHPGQPATAQQFAAPAIPGLPIPGAATPGAATPGPTTSGPASTLRHRVAAERSRRAHAAPGRSAHQLRLPSPIRPRGVSPGRGLVYSGSRP